MTKYTQQGGLQGTIVNTGDIRLHEGLVSVFLKIHGDTTLTGGGTLSLGNTTGNSVFGIASSDVLTNAADHTIQGGGRIGGTNFMGLINQGLILANQTQDLNIDTSAAGGFGNAGTLRAEAGSTMNIADHFVNSGTIHANGGTVNADAGFTHGSGTVLIEGDGVVSIGASVPSGADSSTSFLTHNGSNPNGLSLGNHDLTVLQDYTNANWGVGNSFDHRTNVSGTGLILAGGDVAQAVTGANVTNGTTASPTLTLNTGNVHVGVANTFTYQIANTGTTGPDLRGALQTGVNGGNITDSRLSGSGVTASNWGPVGTGGDSGDLEVVFTADAAGLLAPMTGQRVHSANNFDNVDNQLLSIELGAGAAAYNLAQGSAVPDPVVLGNQRVGGSETQVLTVTNTAPAGAFTEGLNAGFGANTGDASNNGGTVSLLAGGASDGTNMAVGVDTATAGAKSGTVTLNYVSDGTGTSGLGQTAVGSQTIDVAGDVYRLAQGDTAPLTVNLTNRHVGDSASQTLTVSNLAATDGYSESLNASFVGTTGQATHNGGAVNLLAAGGSDNTNMAVGIDTSSAGAKSGTVTLGYQSDGTGTSGLAAIAAGGQL